MTTGTNEMELLTVLIDTQPFGINVAKIKSIQQYNHELVTALPDSKPGVKGMFLYRNHTIPLLDLAEILKVDLKNQVDRQIIVITEFNNMVNSFKVQGVRKIHRLSWKEFVPLNQIFEENSYFSGSVNVDGTEVLVIDLEYILAEIFPELVLQDISDAVIDQKNTISRDELNICFAEDSSIIRKRVTNVLKKAGFSNVIEFENGERALDYMEKNFREIGSSAKKRLVMLTDIEMPKMDGLTLCRNLKQDPDLKDIYVVMFSSLINTQMIHRCKKVNADNYVTKPETTQLIEILDEFCH